MNDGTMSTFKELLQVADTIEPDDTEKWKSITTSLVPLAALALQSADRIPGLRKVLTKHGWEHDRFTRAFDVEEFKADLWSLNKKAKKQAVEAAENSPALAMTLPRLPLPALQEQVIHVVHHHMTKVPTNWSAASPISAFVEKVATIKSVEQYMPVGRIINELTHFAQVAIIEASKMKLECEGFKKDLMRSGWDIWSYSFQEKPDLDKLLHFVTHNANKIRKSSEEFV